MVFIAEDESKTELSKTEINKAAEASTSNVSSTTLTKNEDKSKPEEDEKHEVQVCISTFINFIPHSLWSI